MTRPPTFEDRLDGWLEEGPTDAPGPVLDTVLAAFPSIPQRRGAWGIPWRTTPMLGFARAVAGLVIVIGVGAAVLLLVTRPAPGVVGGSASPSPAAIVTAPTASPAASVAAVVPTATPAPTPVPTPQPTPTATPIGPCATNHLVVRITLWDGAAGSRTAHLELKNASSSPCTVQSIAKPQLVDGRGTVLIDGKAPTSYSQLTVAPGGRSRPSSRTATTAVRPRRHRSASPSSWPTDAGSWRPRSRRRTGRSRPATAPGSRRSSRCTRGRPDRSPIRTDARRPGAPWGTRPGR